MKQSKSITLRDEYFEQSVLHTTQMEEKQLDHLNPGIKQNIDQVNKLGNNHFQRKEYTRAIEHYLLACDHARDL